MKIYEIEQNMDKKDSIHCVLGFIVFLMGAYFNIDYVVPIGGAIAIISAIVGFFGIIFDKSREFEESCTFW